MHDEFWELNLFRNDLVFRFIHHMLQGRLCSRGRLPHSSCAPQFVSGLNLESNDLLVR